VVSPVLGRHALDALDVLAPSGQRPASFKRPTHPVDVHGVVVSVPMSALRSLAIGQ
jgi:hypothetical protein